MTVGSVWLKKIDHRLQLPDYPGDPSAMDAIAACRIRRTNQMPGQADIGL